MDIKTEARDRLGAEIFEFLRLSGEDPLRPPSPAPTLQALLAQWRGLKDVATKRGTEAALLSLLPFVEDAVAPPLGLSEWSALNGGRHPEPYDVAVQLRFSNLVGHPEAFKSIVDLTRQMPGTGDDVAKLTAIARKLGQPPLAVGWDVLAYWREDATVSDGLERRLAALDEEEVRYRSAPLRVRRALFEWRASDHAPLTPEDVKHVHRLWKLIRPDVAPSESERLDPDGRKLRLAALQVRNGRIQLQVARYSHFWYRTVNDAIVHASFDGRYRDPDAKSPFPEVDVAWLADRVIEWRDALRTSWLNFLVPSLKPPTTGSMITCHQSVATADHYVLIFQRAPGNDYQAGFMTFGFEEQAWPADNHPLPEADWKEPPLGILKAPLDRLWTPMAAQGDRTAVDTTQRGLREEVGLEAAFHARPEAGSPHARIHPYAIAFEVNSANAIVISHVDTPRLASIGERWFARFADSGRDARDLELRRCIVAPLDFRSTLPWVLRDGKCRDWVASRTSEGETFVAAHYHHQAYGGPRPGDARHPVHQSSAARAMIALSHRYGWERAWWKTYYWACLWEALRDESTVGDRSRPRTKLYGRLPTEVRTGDWPFELASEHVQSLHAWFFFALLDQAMSRRYKAASAQARLTEFLSEHYRDERERETELPAAQRRRSQRKRARDWAHGSGSIPRTRQGMLAVVATLLARSEDSFNYVDARLLSEAWRHAQVAAWSTRLTAGVEVEPRRGPIETRLGAPAADNLAAEAGWHSLLRVRETIMLFFQLRNPATANDRLHPIAPGELVPDVAGSDRSSASSDDVRLGVAAFVHPLIDAGVRRPRWLIAAREAIGETSAPASLEFIRHRSALDLSESGPTIPLRISLMLFDEDGNALRARAPGAPWSINHDAVVPRSSLARPETILPELLARARNLLPPDIRSNDVDGLEILALGYDAGDPSVVIFLRCELSEAGTGGKERMRPTLQAVVCGDGDAGLSELDRTHLLLAALTRDGWSESTRQLAMLPACPR
jgi:hypothetical protein